ncbi:MAG: beta-propeller domain-containing protein [Actinomycetia bacterium]|nr:beta-propeller domain-containing protein [Actinomycetes bacterium]
MSNDIFKEMQAQMTPDDELLSHLDAALASQDAQDAQAGQTEPSGQPKPDAEPHKRLPKRHDRLFAVAACLVITLLVCGGGILANIRGTFNGQFETGAADNTFALSDESLPVAAVANYDQVFAAVDSCWQEEYADSVRKSAPGNQALTGPGSGAMSDAIATPSMVLEGPSSAASPPVASGPSQGVSPSSATPAYSDTNNQVAEVDEGDIIKTDGRYIYTVSSSYVSNGSRYVLSILNAAGKDSSKLSQLRLYSPEDDPLSGKQSVSYYDMFLDGTTLAVVSQISQNYSSSVGDAINKTRVQLFDVSDPINPKPVWEYAQSGTYYQARLTAGKLYLLSSYYLMNRPTKAKPESFIPSYWEDNGQTLYAAQSISIMPAVNAPNYSVLGSIDLAGRRSIDRVSVLGAADTMYMSTSNIYLASAFNGKSASRAAAGGSGKLEYSLTSRTQIIRVALDDGNLTVAAQGIVDGQLLNQFSLDEYQDNLRLAVTIDRVNYREYNSGVYGSSPAPSYFSSEPTVNAVFVLSPNLEVIGSLVGLAPNERIYSVRFMGDTGYVVTYRQTDPLFAIDLSNPTAPKLLDALKIPGFSTYLHPWGSGRLLGLGVDDSVYRGDGNVKLSMFNISDPKNISEENVFPVPGYSIEALNNHKAVLADPGKNLIGFGDGQGRYLVYCYGDGGFRQLAALELGAMQQAAQTALADNVYLYYDTNYARGLYVDDSLYVFSNYFLDVYSLQDFRLVTSLKIVEPYDYNSPPPTIPMHGGVMVE